MWLRALAGTSVFLLLVGVACGDTYDSVDTADAGSDATSAKPGPAGGDGGPVDAAPPIDAGPRCDPRAPFTKIERIPGVPLNAFCAHLVPDESVLFFSIGSETRRAIRDDAGVFGLATKVAFQEANAACVSPSSDQTLVYYEDFFAILQQSGPAGGPYANKATIAPPKDLALSAPFYDEPRKLLYAAIHIEKGYFYGNYALGVAPVTGGTVGDFQRVDVGFGTTGADEPRDAGSPVFYRFDAPVPSADGLALYYGTSRLDDGGFADMDIWVSTRDTASGAFGHPTRLDSLRSPTYEEPSWVSPDGCRLYFHSDRNQVGVYGGIDAFVATRTP